MTTRLLRDARHFDSRLSSIDGAGNVGTYLIQLVESKQVKAALEEDSTDQSAVDSSKADTETPG